MSKGNALLISQVALETMIVQVVRYRLGRTTVIQQASI